MKDLDFEIALRWSGTGRDGVGEIHTDDVTIDLSAPEAMGGRGVGTNPEELLVSAVASCYTATLFGLLRRTRLPVASLAVDASGSVTGFPGQARFDRVAVSPTILGGDPSRQSEYEAVAMNAHDRCLIGKALAPGVTYEVGTVQVRAEPTPASNGAKASTRASSSSPAGRSVPLRAHLPRRQRL
jgi:peroxiredoxin-like protein